MKTIKQKHYPKLEIDCSEKDIIQIWMDGYSNVIQIERENIQKLIDVLKTCITTDKAI